MSPPQPGEKPQEDMPVADTGGVRSTTGLGVRSATSVMWMTMGAAIEAVLQIGYAATISRLLDPADFGVLAAALLLVRVVEVLSRSGIQNAVVQRPNLSRSQLDLAFKFSLLLGSVSCVAILVAAPLVSLIVDHEQAVEVTRLIAVTALVGGVGAVAEGVLRRNFRFRRLAAIGVIARACGAAVGILLAVLGGGVWSLGAALLAHTLVMAALAAIASGHRPRRTQNWRDGISLLRFGMGSSVIGYFEFIGSSLDTIAVGRWVGGAALGQYNRATMLVQLPAENAANIIGRVLLSSMSAAQGDRRRFNRLFQMTVSIYVLALVVVAAIVATGAPATVRVVLGQGWDEAATALPVVTIGVAFAVIAQPLGTAAEAIGALKEKLAITLIQVAVGIVGIVVVLRGDRSLVAFAGVWAASELCRWVAYQWFSSQRLGIPWTDLVRPYCEALIFGLVLASPVAVTVRVMDLPNVVALAAGLLVGGVLAAGVWRTLRTRLFVAETVRVALDLRRAR
jgi:lipopolysaccharide exporter